MSKYTRVWIFEGIAPTIGDEAIGVGGIQTLLAVRPSDTHIVILSKSIDRFRRNFTREEVGFQQGEVTLFSERKSRLLIRLLAYLLLVIGILTRSRTIALRLWKMCPGTSTSIMTLVESAECVFFQGGPRWNREWLNLVGLIRRFILYRLLMTLNIKIVHLGVAAGPFTYTNWREWLGSSLAKRCLKMSTAVIVRDDKSYQRLSELLRDRLFRAPDYAFGMDATHATLPVSIPANSVCLNLRSVAPRYGVPEDITRLNSEIFVREVVEWASVRGRQVFFLSMNDYLDDEKDSLCLEWIGGEADGILSISNDLTALELKTLLSEFDLIASMRMHPLIVGTSVGIPCIALGYTPKCELFMSDIGLEKYFVKLESLVEGDVARRLSLWEANRDELRAAMLQLASQHRQTLRNVTSKAVDLTMA